MKSILRSTAVVAIWFALAGVAAATQPGQVTLLSFEWRAPFALWFVPGASSTVQTDSLLVAFFTEKPQEPAHEVIQISAASASTTDNFEEWLWGDKTASTEADLFW